MNQPNKWQEFRKTIVSKTEFLLNNTLLSDVQFSFLDEKNTNNEENIIYAHKLILSIGSSVFLTMFNGNISNEKNVLIEDATKEAFFELLRYLYTEKVDLKTENVFEILYLAKKYLIPFLELECINFLKKDLTSSNVCSILHSSVVFESERLKEECFDLISCKTLQVIQDESFIKMDEKTLKVFLNLNYMNCTEMELFQAVLSWAKNRCEFEKIEPTGVNKRKILGELFYLIKFPTMLSSEFTKCAAEGLFTEFEAVDLFIQIASGNDTSIESKFSMVPRVRGSSSTKLFCQELVVPFEKSDLNSFEITPKFFYRTRFSTNQNLIIIGLTTSLSAVKHCECDVEIRLLNDAGQIIAESNNTKFYENFSKILFNQSIELQSDQEYDMEISFGNPISFIFGNIKKAGIQSSEKLKVNFSIATNLIDGFLYKKIVK